MSPTAGRAAAAATTMSVNGADAIRKELDCSGAGSSAASAVSGTDSHNA
jgi:hypothetical protein